MITTYLTIALIVCCGLVLLDWMLNKLLSWVL